MIKEENKEKTIKGADSLYEFDEDFRDSISTVDEEGKRIWIYPKKPSGKYHNRRVYVTILLLVLFFAGPFIEVGGRPFLLINIFERKFILFGAAFWPQDFYILAVCAITFFVFVILFTVTFGRIFCGWLCPQTIFMEMVFRKIEYWIEGDANKQRKLDKAPWNRDKIIKKVSKQAIFIAISILISHTVMAYLIGLDQTLDIITKSPAENMSGFTGLVVFTGIFYWVFSYFREQACTVVCPYGRLQGVLLVKDSIVVMYDWLRGEPRGKIKKNKVQEDKGDCIDCKLCVHVCPTGIDIRNGTQLECVNCTACMDVCDDVMEKVGKPKGLIRYSSHTRIQDGVKKLFTSRVIAYSVVLTLLITLLGFLISTRTDIEASIHRVPGMSFQKTESGDYSNLYNINFLNKTFDTQNIDLKLSSGDGIIERIGFENIKLGEGERTENVIKIVLPKEEVKARSNKISIDVYLNGEKLDVIETNFMGPMPGSNQ